MEETGMERKSPYAEKEKDKFGRPILYDIFTNYHCRADFPSSLHTHSYFEIILVRSGELLCSDGGGSEQIILCAGDLLIISPYVKHRLSIPSDQSMSSTVIKFSLSFLYPIIATESDQQCLFCCPHLRENIVVLRRNEPLALQISPVVDQIMLERTREKLGFDLALRALLLQIYVLMIRSLASDTMKCKPLIAPMENVDSQNRLLMQKAFQYLKENYRNDLSLHDVAAHCGVSYGYFSKLFRKVTLKNFSEYLLEIRLNEAESRLLQPNATVSGVAMDCGFNYTAYFIRKFREKNGITPKKYQEKYGEQ